MADPTPNRCPAAGGQSCKHGHAFTTGCMLPSEQNVPACCREDLVFDERRQAVTIVRTDATARFEEWKARNAGVKVIESGPLEDCHGVIAGGVPVGAKPCPYCDAPPGHAHSSSCPDGVLDRVAAVIAKSADGVGAAPRRQYYYRTAGCAARDAKDPDCTCWHDVGTGPWAKAEADDKRLEWRDAPAGVEGRKP